MATAFSASAREQRAEIQSRRSRRLASFFAQQRDSSGCSPLESSPIPACELDEATGETDVGRAEHAARTAPVHGASDGHAAAMCLMVAPRRNPIDSRDLLRLLLPEIVRAATARLRRVTQTSGHQICKPATLRSRRWAEAMAGERELGRPCGPPPTKFLQSTVFVALACASAWSWSSSPVSPRTTTSSTHLAVP